MAHNYKVGLKNVGSYQSSGTPFLQGKINTDGITVVTFPYVTRWISIYVTGNDPCKIAFSQNGLLGANFFRIPPAGSAGVSTFEVKATAIYLSGGVGKADVMAGLTSIEASTLNSAAFSPSGSNWSGSAWAQVG
jgi:hypothetical protein